MKPAAAAPQTRKDFLSVLDFDPADLERCLELAAQVKADRSLGRQAPTANALDGRHVATLFEKASLRTRSTFEIAVHEARRPRRPAPAGRLRWAAASRWPTSPGTSSDGWTRS